MLSRFRLNQLSKCRRFIPSRGIPITLSKRYKYKKVMDGNEAAAHIAYALSDTCFIYPITPASPMAEHMDEWASSGRKNLFNTTVAVEQMQSEAGAAGAVHGAINTGCLTSTFTSSQGLMLMVPNLFRMANEGVPTVIHVASRSMIKSLGILYLDHSDVMAIRSTGFAILNSGNVQEAMDMALVAHLSALEGKIPFIHFFDGFRTSHEVANVDVIEYSEIEKIFSYDQLEKFRKTGFNPNRPEYRGGATINDVYWQWTENINEYFEKMPDVVENVMKRVESITGRKYAPFEFYGHPEAERIIVLMGSSSQTAKEYIDHLNNKGEKVGMVQVRLYRPFSVEKFLSALPPSWQKMTVLDRCREFGTVGQPLYLDVASAMQSKGDSRPVLAGIYGIGGKDFTPGHLASVFENMKLENPMNNFSIGIKDDKFGRSLPEVEEPDVVPSDTKQLLFFGMGGDGTLGANREAISIISENTDKNVQAYFIFDAKKTNGWTISNLRFGKSKIRAEYEIQYADYVAVHHPLYVNNMPVLDNIREGGVFVLNSPCKTIEDFEKFLPAKLRKLIATKKGNLKKFQFIF
jgi:pyruvate-ferredoxin/flavodoxin oxidoreductase